VLEKRQGAIADQVHRRFVTGDEQQQAHGEQLAFAELVSLLFGCDQEAQKVGLRMRTTLRKKTTEVVGQRSPRRRAPRHKGRIRAKANRVQVSGNISRPAADDVVVVDGDAQHLADHRHRQRIRKVGDNVHRPAILDSVQEPVRDRLDVPTHLLYDPWRKRLVHERPEAGVIGRIPPQHGARELASRVLRAIAGLEQGGKAVTTEARITQAHHDVVITREDPEAHGTLMDGVLLA